MFQDDGRMELTLETGAKIKLTMDETFREKCTKDVLFLDYSNLPKVIEVGKRIYIDDGLISVVAKDIGKLINGLSKYPFGICVDTQKKNLP